MLAESQQVFGPFRLDPGSGLLWHGKEPIRLRAKTLEVLCYLIDHPGQLITKGELLDSVWAKASVSETMPAISVAELRKVMGDDARRPVFIETVHRRGHRFIAAVTQAREQLAAPRSRPFALTPLVGRELEIALLRDHLGRVSQGTGGVVLIDGNAGIGKTRLVSELAAEAARTGVLALTGNCYDRADSMPFVPFVEMLDEVLRRTPNPRTLRAMLGRDAPELSRLLPQLHRLFPDVPAQMELTPPQSQRMLFRAVGDLFACMASERPILLLLEDLQWADQGSLDLTSYLAREVQNNPILILGTYRGDEAESEGPVLQALLELVRLGPAAHLSLSGLSREAVAEMARSLSGRELSSASVTLLYKTTDGNPFFVVELIRYAAMRDRGRSDNFDVVEDSPRFELPHSLRMVVERRLKRIGAETRNTLAVAAVIGRSFEYCLLEAAVRCDRDSLVAQLNEAEKAGLLTSTQRYHDVQFRFVHELLRQAVVNKLTALHRRRLHLQIGQAIEQLYEDTLEEWTDDLAHHFWNAGAAADAAKTVHYLESAGQKAVQSSANSVAISHFRKALQLVAASPSSPQRDALELTLQIALATPLIATTGHGSIEVEAVYSRACELRDGTAQTPELFQILMALQIFYLARANYRTSEAMAGQALEIAEKLGDANLLMDSHRAVATVALVMGQHARGFEHLECALGSYDGRQHSAAADIYGHDPAVGCGALAALAIWLLGFPEKAARLSEEALARAHNRSHPHSTAIAMELGAWLEQLGHNVNKAFECADRTVQFASEYDLIYWRTRASILRGWARAKRGDFSGGIDEIRRGLKTYEEIGIEHLRPFSLVLLAEAYGEAAEIVTSLDLLAEARTIVEATGERFLEPELYRLKGEMTLRLADARSSIDFEDQALESFHRAIMIARDQGTKSLELRATISLACLLRDSDRRPEAYSVLSAIYNWFTEGFETRDLVAAKALLDELA
jgi:DNA-binding winged helix-turn-helix (wHTH) protein/predicted ATPase